MAKLPEGYELPKRGGTDFLSFKEGETKFRILGDIVTGYQYWNIENKPVRSKVPFDPIPLDDMQESQYGKKVQHFWAIPVYDYATKCVSVLTITQKTVQNAISDFMADKEWGDPEKYDISVKREDGTPIKYTVMAKPHKEFSETVDTLPSVEEIMFESESSNNNVDF